MLCDSYNEKEKDWEIEPCRDCGKRQVIFRGPDAKNLFCKWLVNKQHKDVTAIAHNARRYDSYFIYDYLIADSHTTKCKKVGEHKCYVTDVTEILRLFVFTFFNTFYTMFI